jgi:hypothetical protein
MDLSLFGVGKWPYLKTGGWNGSRGRDSVWREWGDRPCTRIHLLNNCVHTLEENEIKSAELASVLCSFYGKCNVEVWSSGQWRTAEKYMPYKWHD